MSSFVGVKLVVMLGSISAYIKPSSSLLSLSVMDLGRFLKNLLIDSSTFVGNVSCSFIRSFLKAFSEQN